MSGSVNKVILVGNLGREPEIRSTQTGVKCATLSIATSKQWRDKESGERKEKTEWHRVTIWNEALVRVAEQYLKTGAKVYIEGELQTRKWTAQDGGDRYTTEVVLQGFNAVLTMLDSQRNGPPHPAAGAEPDGVTRRATAGVPPRGSGSISSGRPSDMDDDIPF